LSRQPSSANELFRIGELARRTGRSSHTIRWYEAQGLMPGVARDAAGRRWYYPDHVQWLELVERLRRTGMSISELKTYASLVKDGRSSLKERRAILEHHRQKAAAELETWQAALRLIDSKIKFYSDWIASGKRPTELPSVAVGERVTAPKRTGRSS
jgi:DNA-binding transcriptional MerR regulator